MMDADCAELQCKLTHPRKSLMRSYDRARGLRYLMDDYLGSHPRFFNDKQFERVFHITPQISSRSNCLLSQFIL